MIRVHTNRVTWPFGGSDVTPRVWTVHPTDSDADFALIQDAINASATGDTILIGTAQYNESLTVNNKILTLVGLSGGDRLGTTGVRVNRATGATATCLTVSGTGSVNAYNISFTITHNAAGAATLKGLTLGGTGQICNFVHCSVVIAIVAPTGNVTVKGVDSAGSTQSAIFNDCTFSITDSIDINTPSLMCVDLSVATSYVFYDCYIFIDDGSATGTTEAIHVAPGAGNGVTLYGGAVDGVTFSAGINRVSGFVRTIGAYVISFTGDTDTDTETNIIKDLYGMVRTDGRQNMYKAALRSITADPGSLADGNLWYRSDLTALRARIAGATRTLANHDVMNWKQPVRMATTANITLSGLQTVDGVSGAANDRTLVKNQTTGSENGIYLQASGAWTRALDADASADVTSGLQVRVSEGTTNAGSEWFLSTANPITLGTTSLSFSPTPPTTGAPTNAQYVTLATDATLSQERVLTAGKNITVTDAGAGSTVTLAESATSRVIGSTLTPTAPGADQNDYSPTNWDGAEPNKATILRIAPTTSIQITGLAGGVAGRLAIIQNTSTDALLILPDESAASTAANRFALRWPIFLMPGASATFTYDATASRWRPNAASSGQGLASQFDSFDDFHGGVGVFQTIVSGTAASGQTGTYLVNSTEKPHGVFQVDSGTTTTGRAYIGSASSNSMVPAQGPALFLCRIAVEALSTVGEEFQIFAGFHDAAAGTNTTDGVYWAYRRTTSVNWMRCAAGASTRTETAGSVAVDTNYVWLGIFLNSGWTQADFFISQNSTSWTFEGSVTGGNLPTATELVQIGVGINKTAGTTQRNLSTDWVGVRYDMVRG